MAHSSVADEDGRAHELARLRADIDAFRAELRGPQKKPLLLASHVPAEAK